MRSRKVERWLTSARATQVCAVAAQPGHTKELQTVQLERGLKIIDSPGVIFDDAEEIFDSAGRARTKGSVLLRNVVKVEDVEDPIAIGRPSFDPENSSTLLNRCS